MRLVSFCRRGRTELGVLVDDRVFSVADLDKSLPASMAELIVDETNALARLREAVRSAAGEIASRGAPLSSLSLLAPVPRPGKIVAIGRNYREHADEEGVDVPTAPLIFAKFPSSIVSHGADIRWDPRVTGQVDYEAELAVVIGRTARDVSVDHALEYVLGYTCLNDVSARDVQFGDGQWTRGKSLDTFCPIGPAVTTADEVRDPQNLEIRCLLNGVVMQLANTREMFFSVAELIAYCSASFTLEPGDIIATGTPGGVGVFRDPPVFLGHDDEIVVEIERVGRLRNRCRVEVRVN